MDMEESPQTPAAETTTKVKSDNNDDFNMEARRRLKNEARLTSGIGKSKQKERNLEIFWKNIWPKLEEAGWTKHELGGAQQGSVTFLPKGSAMEERGGMVSGEQYERIRDVLDRLEEGRSQTEAAIANLYHSLQEEQNQATIDPKSPERRSSPIRTNLVSPKLDLSWKDGGRNFPRKESRVGQDFQVVELPKPGSLEKAPADDEGCIISWDPKEASSLLDEDGELSILEELPPNKRESALELLVERHYVPGDDFVEAVTALPSRNGSDWPPAKRMKFSELVFKLRKDLSAVCTSMDIRMSTGLAYYYAIFKHTEDYRLVKTVRQDEKMDAKRIHQQTPAMGEPDACLICDDGGELLICDGCEGEYHLACMDPPLKAIPEGHWECDECVNKKLLAFRDYLVRQSGLFEAKDTTTDQEDGPIMFKPTPIGLASVRTMAQGISKLLTPDDNGKDEEAPMKVEPMESGGSDSNSPKKHKSESLLI